MQTNKILTFVNIIVMTIIVFGLGFLSMAFYMGTPEQHQVLIKNFPDNFTQRFLFFWVVGATLLGMQTLINFLLNKTVTKSKPIKLKFIFIVGIVSLTIFCLAGSLHFFDII